MLGALRIQKGFLTSKDSVLNIVLEQFCQEETHLEKFFSHWLGTQNTEKQYSSPLKVYNLNHGDPLNDVLTSVDTL